MFLQKFFHHPRLRTWWERLRGFFRHRTRPQTPEGSSQEFKPETLHDHALVLSVTKSARFPRWQQLRFVNRSLNQRERRVFWTAALVGSVMLLIGLAGLTQGHIVTVPKAGGTVTEGLIGSPKLINPLFAPLNDVDRDLSAMVYSGLFRLDENLEPQPDLAEHYTWLDHNKTLEVSLRPNIFFHDGEPLTADDVVFTYQALKTWHSPLANTFHGIKVIRINNQTVQFQLEKANLTLLSSLNLGILPAHLWSEVPETSATLAEMNLKPVGSGPYQAVSFTRDSKGSILTYHFGAFPKYYGPPSYIHDWNFQFYPDRFQAQNALRGNQVDALAFLPWGEISTIKNKNIQGIRLELPQETVAFFNVKNSLLKDERVRRALAMAIDPQELQTLIGPHATPINSPFPFLEATTGTPPDLEKARALLQSAGWQLKEGETVRHYAAPTPPSLPKKRGQKTVSPPPTVVNASSTAFVFTIDVPNQPDLLKVADFLKRRWSLLGAQVEIHSQEAEPLLRDAVTNRSYQVLLWNILLPEDQDLTPFWSSSRTGEGGLNLSNLEDRDVDIALETVKSATGTAGLITARGRLSNAILAHVPAIFLVRPAYAYLVSQRIHGVTDQRISRPSERLHNTTQWYVKTGWRWK